MVIVRALYTPMQSLSHSYWIIPQFLIFCHIYKYWTWKSLQPNIMILMKILLKIKSSFTKLTRVIYWKLLHNIIITLSTNIWPPHEYKQSLIWQFQPPITNLVEDKIFKIENSTNFFNCYPTIQYLSISIVHATSQ